MEELTYDNLIKNRNIMRGDAKLTPLIDLLNTKKIINNKNNNSSIKPNFVDALYKEKYLIDGESLTIFFELLNSVRITFPDYIHGLSIVQNYENRKNAIKIDMDILQETDEVIFDQKIMEKICELLFHVIYEHVDFSKEEKEEGKKISISVLRKPAIVPKDNFYKDGIHILFNSMLFSKEERIFLATKCNEKLKNNLKGILGKKKYQQIKNPDKIIDILAVSTPALLYGSRRRTNQNPYKLISIYEIELNNSETFNLDEKKIDKEDITFNNIYNLCFDLNLVYQREVNPLIKKDEYFLKEEFRNQCKKVTDDTKNIFNLDDIDYYIDPINIEITDLKKNIIKKTLEKDYENEPDFIRLKSIVNRYCDINIRFKFLRDLLDCISNKKEHIEEFVKPYDKWFRILAIIISEKKSADTSNLPEDAFFYLAHYISIKADNYDYNSITQKYSQLSSDTNCENPVTIRTLKTYAVMCNPEMYERICSENINKFIIDKIFSCISIDGFSLTHEDIASIVYFKYKDIFITTGSGQHKIWYEFVVNKYERNALGDNEIFKYRKSDSFPDTIYNFISSELSIILKNIMPSIKSIIQNINNGMNESTKKKFLRTINRSFTAEIKKIGSSSNINSVLNVCSYKFFIHNFEKVLDRDPDVVGVPGGIIVLGKKTNYITSIHNYYVTKYTTTRYIEFDFDNPRHIKVLECLRMPFPDTEASAFWKIIGLLAFALSGRRKPPFLLQIWGTASSGKSSFTGFINEMMGDYAESGRSTIITGNDSNISETGANSALSKVIAARCCQFPEIPAGADLKNDVVKRLTGGDKIATRDVYKSEESFQTSVFMYTVSNYLIKVSKFIDSGIWRRLLCYEFKIKFVDDPKPNSKERKIDPTFDKQFIKDKENLSILLGFFTYMFELICEFYNGDPSNISSPIIDHESELYRNKYDYFNKFIGEMIIYTPKDVEMKETDIYQIFIEWMKENHPLDAHIKYNHSDLITNSKLATSSITKEGNVRYIINHRMIDKNDPQSLILDKGEKRLKIIDTEIKEEIETFEDTVRKLRNRTPPLSVKYKKEEKITDKKNRLNGIVERNNEIEEDIEKINIEDFYKIDEFKLFFKEYKKFQELKKINKNK